MGKEPNNLTVLEYINLEKEEKEVIDFFIKNGLKPNSFLRINGMTLKPKEFDLWNLSWNDVIYLRECLKENSIEEVIELLYYVRQKNMYKCGALNLFAVYKWVNEQMNAINKTVNDMLGKELTEKEKKAGYEELMKYGETVSVHTMAGNQLTKHKEVLSEPYINVFKIMCLNKDINEIQENVSREN